MYFSQDINFLLKVQKSAENKKKCGIVQILVNSAELHLCTFPDAPI